VSDPEVRIDLYARLARLRDIAAIDEFAAEIEDRFGVPPPATRTLLDAVRVREMARREGAIRVDVGPRGIAVSFDPSRAAHRPRTAGGSEGEIAGFRWKEDRLVSDRPGTESGGMAALIELFDALDCL
jgi:transcription-repair coupling factor (superfamily II helicase)